MVEKTNGFGANNGTYGAPKLNPRTNLEKGNLQDKGVLESILKEDVPAHTKIMSSMKQASQPVTQIEVQGMSDQEIKALNKKEITKLVSLLPKPHQDALLDKLLSLEQINVNVGRPLRAKIDNKWSEILPESPIQAKDYERIINAVSLDHESKRGGLKATEEEGTKVD